jgi:hypothetical protein
MVTLDKKYQTTLDSNPGFVNKTYCCISSKAISTTKSIAIINFKTLDLFVGFMKSILQPKINQIKDMGIYKFYYCSEWQDNFITVENFNAGKDTTYKKTLDDINSALSLIKDPLTGFDLGSDTDIKKFVYGKSYTPTPTPTPSSAPVVVTPTTNLITVTRTSEVYGDRIISVKVAPNVGLWKIKGIEWSIPINSPCSNDDDEIINTGNITEMQVNPYTYVDDTCNQNVLPGSYVITFVVNLEPIKSDATDTRSAQTRTFYSTWTKPAATTSVTINYLGEFNTTQGNDSSYYNIQQNNGNFKVLRIVDSNFNFNNVGIVQFKDSSGTVTPYSCSAGSGSNTCTVNGRNAGTYTMNVQYYPSGPLNSSAINLVSPPFTQ